MTIPPDFTFLMILNDPEIARFVTQDGCIHPMVDLEVLGKEDRQGHLNTWRSSHSLSDVTRIREAEPDADLVVRINPLNDGTKAELDEVITRGADRIMLPMFSTRDELALFFDLLGDRARALPLFETAGSVAALADILRDIPLTEIHIGLNDLHLSLGCDFMFQPLSDGYLDEPAILLNEANVRFGVGGIARASEGQLQPEILLGEHSRLGSRAAILSRTFHRNAPTLSALQDRMEFFPEVEKLLEIKAGFDGKSLDFMQENQRKVKEAVELIRSQKTSSGMGK